MPARAMSGRADVSKIAPPTPTRSRVSSERADAVWLAHSARMNSGPWCYKTKPAASRPITYRVTDVQTNLVTLEYGGVTPLPKSLSLKSEVSVLASSKPLPDTERIGLGGIHAVRGYVTEDGAVDQALVLRNSLYVAMPSMLSWMPGTLAPLLLADVGWGRDLFSRRASTLSSVGAGLDFAAGTNFNSKLLAARAMTDGLHTPAGSWRVSLQASVSY
jgi:hemolysin activation/secretion protein